VDAWCHKREQLLSFSVDAISSCEMLEDPAKEIDPKELQKQMQAGYGIFSGQDVSWAKLKFSAQRASYSCYVQMRIRKRMRSAFLCEVFRIVLASWHGGHGKRGVNAVLDFA